MPKADIKITFYSESTFHSMISDHLQILMNS